MTNSSDNYVSIIGQHCCVLRKMKRYVFFFVFFISPRFNARFIVISIKAISYFLEKNYIQLTCIVA